MPWCLFLQHVTDVSEYAVQKEEHQIVCSFAFRIMLLWWKHTENFDMFLEKKKKIPKQFNPGSDLHSVLLLAIL